MSLEIMLVESDLMLSSLRYCNKTISLRFSGLFVTRGAISQVQQTFDIFVSFRAVTRSSLERKVRGSNFGPVKLNMVLPTARNRCNILKGAMFPGHN